MATWSVDALEALRPRGRTGVYHLDSQIVACEQAADAQAGRPNVPGKTTRKNPSRSTNGRPLREQVDRRGRGKPGGKPRRKREPAKELLSSSGGARRDSRTLIRVDLPRTPGVLKIYGAQSPARPLPDVVEEDVPSRPVGWSQTATWTGGE